MILALIAAALAAPPMARDLHGDPVSLAEGTIVVVWKIDDPESARALAVAQEASVEGRLPVVAVSLDGASARSRLAPYLAARGITIPVVTDADGSLRQRLVSPAPGFFVLGDSSVAIALGEMASEQELVRAVSPPVPVADGR